MKKYQIIYADPPWSYRHRAAGNRSIERHYPTMTHEDIKNLKIPAEENSLLYMWTTAPKLLEGLEVLTAWGFDYRNCFVWDKEMIGLGYWCRVQHEIILIGVKGYMKPPPQGLRISSVIKSKRGKHSDKPDYFRHMIDKWYPNCTKLEIFCRDHTPLFKKQGWDVWGNEVESDIDLTANVVETNRKEVK